MKKWLALALCAALLCFSPVGARAQAGGEAVLQVPAPAQVTAARFVYLGDFEYALSSEDGQALVGLLQGVRDLRQDDGAGDGEILGALELDTAQGCASYFLTENTIYRNDGGARPNAYTKSGSLRALADFVREVRRRYTPTVGPFTFRGRVDTVHFYRDGDKTFVETPEVGQVLTALSGLGEAARPARAAQLGRRLEAPDTMAIYYSAKLSYDLYENGMVVRTEAEGFDFYDKAYTFTDGYDDFKKQAQQLYTQGTKGNYWLGMMRHGRLERGKPLLVQDSGKGKRNFTTRSSHAVFQNLKRLPVLPQSCERQTEKALEDARLRVELHFKGGITYLVTVDDSRLQVYSSDVGYAIRHRLAPGASIQELLDIAGGKEIVYNPGT